jgi:hypothetical protein
MTKRIDITHLYKPPWSAIQAHCRLRIYDHDGRTVIMVTEQPNNQGMSVTNYAGELATMLVTQYQLDPAQTIFIEHYPPAAFRHGATAQEQFDLVMFTWQSIETVFNRLPWTQIAGAQVRHVATNPIWRRLAVEEVERMTGDNFNPMNQMIGELGFQTLDGDDFDDWTSWER